MSAAAGADDCCGRPDPRPVLDRLTRAVSVVSVRDGTTPHAVTVDSLTSVSADPPLVLVSLLAGSRTLDLVRRSGLFGASLLASDQAQLARWFASRRRGAGAAQFTSVPCWQGSRSGAPLLLGALAWLECRLASEVPAGDHVLVIGAVLDAVPCDRGGLPLLRQDRTYRSLSTRAPAGADSRPTHSAMSAVSAGGAAPLWR